MTDEKRSLPDPGQSVPEFTRKELIDAIMNRGEDPVPSGIARVIPDSTCHQHGTPPHPRGSPSSKL